MVSFRLVCIAAAWVVVASAASAQQRTNHGVSEERVMVEHAEILPDEGPAGGVTAYLTLWNGTRRRADLTRVTSPAFGSVALHCIGPGDGAVRSPLDGGIVPIPAKAEMIMRPGGIYLALGRPISVFAPGDTTTFHLAFDDGTTISATAVVRATGGDPVDHHHGEDDG